MSRNLLLWTVAPALTASALLLLAEPAQAQWRGGGGYQGGAYGGNYGSFGNGFGNFGNYLPGNYGGYSRNYNTGYGTNFSSGYSPYSYGYSRFNNGYSPYSAGYSPYTPSYTYGSAPTVGYSSFYPTESASPATDMRCRVNIRVPTGAQVRFDGQATTQTGEARQFVSPPLTPGSTYTYEIAARWDDNGKPVERKETVRVKAGEVVNLDLTRARATADEP